jgi:hypothetical protein
LFVGDNDGFISRWTSLRLDQIPSNDEVFSKFNDVKYNDRDDNGIFNRTLDAANHTIGSVGTSLHAGIHLFHYTSISLYIYFTIHLYLITIFNIYLSIYL